MNHNQPTIDIKETHNMELTYNLPQFAIGAPPPPAHKNNVNPMHSAFLLRCTENPNTWVSVTVPTRKSATAAYVYLKSKGIKAVTRSRNGEIRVYGIKETA